MGLWSMLPAYLLDSPFLDDDDDQISNCGRLLTICKSPVCEVPTLRCSRLIAQHGKLCACSLALTYTDIL